MRSLAFSVLAIALVACGGEPPPKDASSKTPATTPPTTTTTTAAPATVKTTSLHRARVRDAIGKGLGVLLRNVAVEDMPEFRNDKFYGFKIKSLNPEWGVDLQPGDVIVKVNGMTIERPEHADAALRSLDKAPSLRVDYERAGKMGVLELPIVDP